MHGGRAVGRPVAVLLGGFVAMTTVSLGTASYHPLAANTRDRREDISGELGNFDVLALQGTRKRGGFHNEPVTICSCGGKLWLDAGWRAGPGTKKSTGRSIVLGGKFRRSNVMRTWACG